MVGKKKIKKRESIRKETRKGIDEKQNRNLLQISGMLWVIFYLEIAGCKSSYFLH